MGIESDQVVYEYLSRVGDVAQQQHLSSAVRMRLVSELRNEIDRCRAKAAVDSPAAVRGILDRLGSPDEIVAAAGGAGGRGPQQAAPAPAVPVQREPEAPAAPGTVGTKGASGTGDAPTEAGTERTRRPRGLRRMVPGPRPAEPAASPPPSSGGALPPHLATAGELGGSAAARGDWWRTDGSPFGIGDDVPGFVGGVEISDLLKAPALKEPPKEDRTAPADAAVDVPADRPEPAPARRRFALLPRRAGTWSNPLLLLAAVLLVAGAVLGNWIALLLGWVIAYGSRRLTPLETKWAVMGMPGLAVAAGLVWLWGRDNGRWGDPIAQGHVNDAVTQTWPWVVRSAAVLSALFLVWRSQRQRER
ncbi:hypothetical protein ACF061_34880 [Streptomyces sp. NPDC015220]|uniref:hypothetical protein n=1 Tax=Streptomyces sp. NPDC015220 TaxID=3364947 RepID=UPI0036F7449F